MKFDIDIPDDKVTNLSKAGKETLLSLGDKYLNEILDEADRIEVVRNTSFSDSEITGPIIKDADDYIKRFRVRKKTKWWILVLQIVAYVSTLLTGGLFDIDNFVKVGYVMLFLSLFFICTASTIILIFQGVKNE